MNKQNFNMEGLFLRVLAVISILGLTITPIYAWTAGDETTLRGSLISGYETDVRPSGPTEITMAFWITGINDVDLKGEVFSVSGFWSLEWADTRLSWTPASHGNIGLLIYGSTDVWTPAIVVMNSLDNLSAIGDTTIPVRADSNGNMEWTPSAILELGCELDTTHFPFDQQTCSIQTMTLGYCGNEVTLNSTDGIMFDFYTVSGQWVVDSTEKTIMTQSYKGRDVYIATFSMTMTRRSSTYWGSTMIPIIIFMFLVTMVFVLPAASGEKMGYSLTCLLAFVVILTIINDSMSTSAKHTSLLQVFIVLILMFGAMTVVLSCITLFYYNKPEKATPPHYLNQIASVMIMTMYLPSPDKEEESVDIRADFKNNLEVYCPKVNDQNYRADTPIQKFVNDDETRDTIQEQQGLKLTYQQFSETMDAFFFRLYMLLTSVMTVIFLMVLEFGK